MTFTVYHVAMINSHFTNKKSHTNTYKTSVANHNLYGFYKVLLQDTILSEIFNNRMDANPICSKGMICKMVILVYYHCLYS